MTGKTEAEPLTTPVCQEQADRMAAEMAAMDVEETARQLGCSRKIALESWLRYQEYFSAPRVPAVMAYNGQAYRHLRAATLGSDALAFAQDHLWITSFLYGLLRPMDGIVPYRMEHNVRLAVTGGRPVSQYWKDKLTDILIETTKADDGTLVHLSTAEYERLFDWQRVRRELHVVQPLFYVRTGNDLKMQVVWAKACRGAMVRFILGHQTCGSEGLRAFSHEGFGYDPRLGEEDFPHFVRG